MHPSRSSITLCALVAILSVACGSRDAVHAAQEGFLAGAGGAQIFYRVVGAGPDTVVAVHGGPGAGMNAFFPDLQPLTARHTVIFYDQRGGGRSELPADTALLDAQYHVEDLEAVRRHFRLERMTVIAHSFGSILVATYAESHPERLARLVFLGAVGPQRAAAAAVAQAPYADADSVTLHRLFRVMEALMTGAATDPVASCREYEAIVGQLAAARERISGEMAPARGDSGRWQGSTCNMPAEAVRYFYHYTARIGPNYFGDWDFTSTLRRVTAPVLVISSGDRDAHGGAAQRGWVAAFANARLLVVPGDQPHVIFAAIDEFLSGQWPSAATVSSSE